jgi:ATP-binding cassette subfamily B multidrug efflux pump
MIKLFRFLQPYRLLVGLILAFIFLQSLSELYLPTLLADIVDKGILNGDTGYILKIGAFMLAVTAAGAAFSIGASYLSSRVSAGFGKIVRGKLFAHVERFSLQEFDRIGTASLITRTTNDITQVQSVLMMMLRMMVAAPMMCIGGIIMAVSKDAELSLVIVVIVPVLALTIYGLVRRGLPLFRVMQTKLDKLNLVLRENLTGIRVIRSFHRMGYEQSRFDVANLDVTATGVKVNQIMAAMMPAMMLLMNVSSIAIIWFGGLRIESGHMEVGDLMAFLQYAMQIMFSLMMVSMMFVMVPRAAASAVRINEVLNMEAAIQDNDNGIQERSGIAGEVVFDRVSFRYPGAEKPALSDISFTANSGEVTAVIGGTGSGKSTLVSLIPRFYDIEAGSIKIDGIDVRELSQQELRAKIGYVPQKAVLFTGTVAENIRYGKEDATDEEIRHAAAIAQAADFVEGMENGYDTVLAQGGNNLSGGQKQRLSIARALVRRPGIYLFDDSFSALDYKTEAKLRASLKRETTDAVVLIVAQRVSTVIDADRIVVLDDGGIAGIGRHDELMKTCGIYREIVSSQLSGASAADLASQNV